MNDTPFSARLARDAADRRAARRELVTIALCFALLIATCLIFCLLPAGV
jgi:hypothetical protein